MNNQFVGFGTFEKWLGAIDQAKPVNADCLINPGSSGTHGITVNTQEIVVSQVNGSEVLYCNIIIGRYQSIAGSTEPLAPTNSHARALSAWQIIQDVLQEHQLKVREALIATPKNLKTLDGFADCLHYNKETKLFERTNQQALAAEPAC